MPADSLEQPATVPKGRTAGSGLPAKAAKAAKQPAKRARQAIEASDRKGQGRTKSLAERTAAAAPEPLSAAAAANAEIMRAFGGLGRKRGSAALSGAPVRAHSPAGRAPAAALQGNALPSPIATQQREKDVLQQRTSNTRAAAAAPASSRYDLAAKLAAESADAAALDPQGAPTDATMADALDAPGQTSLRGTQAPAEAGMGGTPADRSPAGNAAAQEVGGPAGETGGASAVRAAGDVLGQQQSAVKCAAAAKDGSMCDLLNPNNPLYDPAFALEYAQIRWGALIPAVLTPCRCHLCLNIRHPLANDH